MRHAVVLAALLAAVPGQAQAPPPSQGFEVPQDKGPQRVEVLMREFPVGGVSGWHTHPGVEIAYLVAGTMSLEQEGRSARRLEPGDSFLVPRGVRHNGANLGDGPARLVITYVTDKGAPLRQPASAPGTD